MIDIDQLREKCALTLNRLAKWRTVFASWQLGTRPSHDPECQAIRDHREATILLRAEVNALAALLAKKKVFTEDEWFMQLIEEAQHLMEAYEKRFPGFKANDIGMNIDLLKASKTMEGWPP